MVFNLTADDVLAAYILQGGKCALCGKALRVGSAMQRDPLRMSIDRIDSSRGYVRDNIQLVGFRLNLMKGDMSNAEFFSWCRFVTENNERRGDDLMELIESAQPLEESDQKCEKSLS